MTQGEAYLTHWILEGNTNPATNVLWGSRAELFDQNGVRRHAGFKTGTTNDFRDVSGFGYVPGSLVTGVWMGNNNQEPLSNALGQGLFSADGPLYMWHDFMEIALNQVDEVESGFEVAGLQTERVVHVVARELGPVGARAGPAGRSCRSSAPRRAGRRRRAHAGDCALAGSAQPASAWTTRDGLGRPSCSAIQTLVVDQRVEVDAGLDAEPVQLPDQVLGGEVAGGALGVRAAAEPAGATRRTW